MFKIQIPLEYKNFGFDQESILRINQRLQHMFNQQLIDMVTMTNEKKGDILQSVLCFLDFYKIEDEDLQLDTALKMYYRAKFPKESDRRIREDMDRYKQLTLFDAPTGSTPRTVS